MSEAPMTSEPATHKKERRWSVHFDCQWPALLRFGRGFNWVDFEVIRLGVEYDKAGPQLEINVALLGFALYFACALPWSTEQSRHLRGLLADYEVARDSGDLHIVEENR